MKCGNTRILGIGLFTFQFILMFVLGTACAQAADPAWHATVRVIDENQKPVEDAKVGIWYYVNVPLGQSEQSQKVEGSTDTNGIFRASHQNTGSIDLGFQASKQGYYPSKTSYQFTKFKDSDPKKWIPDITLMIKRMRTPVAMYARAVNLGVPVLDKPVGFDFTAGDWTSPFGKGANSDILFTLHPAKSATGQSSLLTITFPNRGDGIQEFAIDRSMGNSDLLSAREAPAEGYQPEFVQIDNRGSDRNYYFRIRTILDEHGNIKSALYGKIYGDFMQFRYFLNPTANDRNVEFDPKKNLLNKKVLGGVPMNMP